MKLGIVSAIYDGFTFEEMIDNASANGYECVEVACWPQGSGALVLPESSATQLGGNAVMPRIT